MSVTEVHDNEGVGASTRRRRRRLGGHRSATPTPPHQRHAPDTLAGGVHRRDLAPMWRRLMARLLDVATVGTWMFTLAVAHIFLHLQLWSDSVAPRPWGNWFLATITFAVCYALYEIVFISRTGATPGKDLMRVRVVDHLTGDTPSVGQAVRRWLLPGLVQPIPGPWIGAGLTAVWGATAFTNREQRTVHDQIAGTRVVLVDPPDTPEAAEERRKQFRPRFVDPLAFFRLGKADPESLRKHPSEH